MRSNIKIKRVRGHYEISVGGQFHCSCDTIGEVLDEIFALENKGDTRHGKCETVVRTDI